MPDPETTSGLSLRDAILGAARDLLLETGYEGISMRKVADRIGYSATSIYLHFRNKDALFHALIDDGMARLHASVEAARQQSGEPFGRLHAMCAAYVRFALENPAYYEVMFNLHPRHMARYPVDRYRAARRILDLFTDELAAALEHGQARAEDPRTAANVVWAALHGAVTLVLAQRIDARLDPQAFLDAALAHALCGLHPPT